MKSKKTIGAFYRNRIKGFSLTAMLVIPFLLYFAARFGAPWQVMALLAFMGLNMLVVLKKG
ncbi:hypothetical protein DSCA_49680 [Desulfosarcina alkanivorans]|jgi:hypothetical protein|uniref:Uncharacterized protein n=1 Tax=Desulfosarcina alkanivorans TaxID=571177 RepID=A0A5K7YQN8_9BACT|nr:hypothetical protein [Desulfosarcina alkanivorans]BBO71038.1 hypothetical protein DSCA_49680 [Desulfosarcina alkanivorans]